MEYHRCDCRGNLSDGCDSVSYMAASHLSESTVWFFLLFMQSVSVLYLSRIFDFNAA